MLYRAGFWHRGFLTPISLLRKFGYLQAIGTSHRICPNSGLQKNSPRQVDRVVKKTRRRRRLSLLTPITSRGCLVQVGQLLPFNSIRPTAIRGFVVYTTGFYGGQDFDWQRGSRASCFRELLRSEGWTFLRHTVDSEHCSSVEERSTLASVFVSAEASSWLEQSRKEETISQWELVHLMTTGQSRRSAPVHAAMDLDCTVPDLPHERAYTSHHAQHRTNLAQSSKNRTPEAQTKLH